MPDVSPIGHGPAGPVNRTTPASPTHDHERFRADAAEPSRDRVELSPRAKLLEQIRELPDVRTDRVDAIRKAIKDGSYETEERLTVAIDRLLQDLRE